MTSWDVLEGQSCLFIATMCDTILGQAADKTQHHVSPELNWRPWFVFRGGLYSRYAPVLLVGGVLK